MPERTCALADDFCDSYYARGLCHRHYRRAHRAGILDEVGAPSLRVPGQRGRAATCAFCGVSFRSRRKSTRRGGGWVQYCSKSCARKAEFASGELRHLVAANMKRALDPDATREERRRRKGEDARRSRRARLAGAAHEPYTLAEIAARDGAICGICLQAISFGLRHPDPLSPSIDHIIPLSCGGDDLKGNVRLAHLGCNLRRGNRMGWEPNATAS